MKTAFFIFIVFCVCITNNCFSQQYTTRPFSFPQGLLTYNIKKTLQDKFGFIWVATQYGIYRYDGRSFESFSRKVSDSNSIRENFIPDIAFGEGEDLYIGIFNAGIDVMNIRTLKITPFLSEASGNVEGLPNLWITKIYFDSRKQLWIGGKDYLLVYNTETKHYRYFDPPEKLKGNINVSFIKPADSTTVVVGLENSETLVFDAAKFTLKSKIVNLGTGENETTAASDMVISNGNCYISSGATVYAGNIIDGKWVFQKKYRAGTDEELVINCLDLNGSDGLWLGTSSGVAGLNLSSGHFFFLNNNGMQTDENFISHLFTDNTNNLWISSYKNLQLANLDPSPFHAYKEDIKAGIRMNHVYSLVPKNDDEIYACGTDGLYLCNIKSGRIKKIKGTGSIGIVHHVLQLPEDVWVISTGSGMYAYLPEKEIISRDLLLRQYPEWKNFVNQYFNTATKAENKIYWASEGQDGLLIWDIEKKTINTYKAGTSSSKGLPENHIHNIKIDKENFVWLLFDNAVAKFDPVKDTVVQVISYKGKKKTFNAGIYFDMLDDGSVLWFGTYGGGINGYNKKDETWTYITEEDGLCNNAVYGILPESDSVFWVSTNNGISRVNHRTKKCTNFFAENGLHDNSFDEKGALQHGSNLFFAGVNGFTGIDITGQYIINYPFPVYIKRVEYIVKKKKTTMNRLEWKTLILPAGTTTATIWLSALTYTGNKPVFSYRIQGFQDEFLPVDGDYKIELNALAKGDYNIDFRYINEKGDFVTEGLQLKLEVLPFWYQTWWFTMLIIFASMTLIYYAVRLRYKIRLRKQRAILEKQLAVQYERQRISAEMHDDIGAGLSGIKLMTEIAGQKIKDEETAAEMKKIYSSVGEISSAMKEVIWSLNTENDRLESLVSYIQRQIRSLLENYPCQLSFKLPDVIPDVEIDGHVRRNIYLAVKESVHNIVKHSKADKVHISVTCKDNLNITVADNGTGVEKDYDNFGNGLKNMERRMHTLNGGFSISNHQGTTVVFTIPIKDTV